MSLGIDPDHGLLVDTAARFVADRCPPSVVRSVVDAAPGGGPPGLPPFWDDLVALGWTGMAVPEVDGGQGAGLLEQAIVLEQLGRAVAPGPALSTAWVATLLAGHPEGPSLATGERIGTVALDADLVVDDDGRVTGEASPVLAADVADVVLVPIRKVGAGGETWALLAVADAKVEPLGALDLTRPLARLTVEGVAVEHLALLDRGRVEAVGIVLAAAEAAGGASWCVDTAASYASVRRQFGRPIGQFQAVKHRCADMLVRLEQARAVAWDAALALDADPDAVDTRLAVAGARAVAFDAFEAVAQDCIQVLGGIGFTWEHDAHLYLRRAVALRQLLGGGAEGRAAVATVALAGVRRHLQLDLPASAEAVRAEIAPIVDAIAELPKDERRRPLADAGLIVPHWPAPWGRDADAVEQVVIDQEMRRARVRAPHLTVGAWAAPTIAAHGTVEQQERWVRPTLHGEISWCQLFSEPEAGSDLAALTTAARRTEGGWLLTGQKVWTTMAKEADWGICLARTNPDAPKHLGITYFVVDMSSAGLDIRPLREMTGLEMFNEVFLDDVFVPDDCVIGEVDGGWPLARTTLANERVSMGSGSSFGGGVEALVALVAERCGADPDGFDPRTLDELGGLVAEAHSLAVMGLRTAVRSVTGAEPGSEASVRKLLGVEHDQRTQAVGLHLLGPEAATTEGAAAQWTFGYLANRCLTIAGGTSEIQRNIIGERLLGLPRDPEPTR